MNIRMFEKAGANLASPQLMFPHFLPWLSEVFSVTAPNREEEMKHRKFAADWFLKSHVILMPPPVSHVGELQTDQPIDFPFDHCYFEAPDENFSIASPNPATGKTDVFQICFLLTSDTKAFSSIFAYGFREGDPDNVHGPKFYTSLEGANIERDRNHEWLKYMARHLCNTLRTQTVATERLNLKQKARVNGKNIHHRIKEVIHVVPRKNAPFTRVSESSTIDWSHRWEVRGHWRTIEGTLGKDRHGQYCVPGFTWVSPHERGPENKPLVKKIREFKPEQGAQP